MKLFFKSAALIIPLFSSLHFAYGMNNANEAPYFPHALRMATEHRDFTQLERCVTNPTVMNHDYTKVIGMYPLAAIVESKFDSNLLITAFLCGARADFCDSQKRSLFHWIAEGYRVSFNEKIIYFPKKNLLAALTLSPPANTFTQNGCQSQLRIKAALLCLNRMNPNLKMGPIKYCILGHLEEDIYSAKLLELVLSQRTNPELYIGKYPLTWLQSAVKGRTGADRSKYVAQYARALAWFRLNNVLPLLKYKDIHLRTPYKTAKNNVRWTRQLGVNSPASIQDSTYIMEYFNPRGFVRRHLPECTKIMENLLEDKEPFDGFKPF